MLPTKQQHLEQRIKPQKALELSLSVLLPHDSLTVVTAQQKPQQQVVDYDFNGALICFQHLRLLLLFSQREGGGEERETGVFEERGEEKRTGKTV